ncbi:membrane-bound alpha-1,6- mannosyltransferase Initiation-specific [Saitozyma podzolica]|uniref:Membrane-bound alpha-1,6-mannosyltransferase Initiation-specific n=1 Tax=Saitozyma podzolica TaxID=1890683 RepID=A0A427Y3N6_9TREE|nr:membrane-bound alpha-1,6- mannosyltransferase Initiation-specific [Saitozyma podzolica]
MVRFSPFRWLSSTSRRRNTALAAGMLLLLALSTRLHLSHGSGLGTYSQSIFRDPQDPQDDGFGGSSGAAAVAHRPLDSDPDFFLENENESSSSSSTSTSPSSPDLASDPASIAISDAEQALETLASAYEEERLSHLSSINYDPSVAEEQIHCPPGSLSPSIDAYISRLESFVGTYFAGSPHHDGLMRGSGGTPPEFEGWKDRVKGWEVRVGDDQQVEEWFQECTGGQGLSTGIKGAVSDSGGVKGLNHGHERVGELDSEAEAPTPAASPWRSLWDGIDRPVIKADMLRYLVMLIKGGMYTDSDTALTSHSLRPNPTHPHPLNAQGISNPSISVVLSVEYDLDNPLQDPRPGYRRDLQIVQWTFLAKPYHPIFLDVLETAVATIESYRDQGVKENWSEVLDITGPGPFTDAVLRYLLVEYGVAPQEIQNLQQAAIIGDVLLLPLHAFGSFLDEWENKWDLEPATRCVAHGFRGRWKWDWGMVPGTP